MPAVDWTVFAEIEPYEKEFPSYQHEDVRHTYRCPDGFEDKKGLLVISPFSIRFIEYSFLGAVKKTVNGYVGKLLELPVERIDDLKCGTRGKERRSFYIFEKSVSTSEKSPRFIQNTPYSRNLIYVSSAQRFGMRFNFKTPSELESAISSYKSARTSLKSLLNKMDVKLLGKVCPFCNSPHLKPYAQNTVRCESCGKLHSPEKLNLLR